MPGDKVFSYRLWSWGFDSSGDMYMSDVNKPTNKSPIIKFSHHYQKFGDMMLPFEARLIQCLKVHFNDLKAWFIEYDTRYKDGFYYDLPKTDLIILFLLEYGAFHPKLFTTIRRYTPQKWEYYNSMTSEVFKIVKSK